MIRRKKTLQLPCHLCIFQYITNTLSFQNFLTKFYTQFSKFSYKVLELSLLTYIDSTTLVNSRSISFLILFIYNSAFFEKALLLIDRYRIQRTMKLTRDLGRQTARSIQPKFPEISALEPPSFPFSCHLLLIISRKKYVD